MNAQRFVAANSREAMALARAHFGEQAVILSSRSTPEGFEVVATSEDQLSAIAAQVAAPSLQPATALPEHVTPARHARRCSSVRPPSFRRSTPTAAWRRTPRRWP
jgi:flagellar biosynthesis protein FlhF